MSGISLRSIWMRCLVRISISIRNPGIPRFFCLHRFPHRRMEVRHHRFRGSGRRVPRGSGVSFHRDLSLRSVRNHLTNLLPKLT